MARKVVYDHRGDAAEVLAVTDAADPGEPGHGQVRVRITTFPIHPGDLSATSGTFRGSPGEAVVAGIEATGIVEAIGPNTRVAEGVRVGARVGIFPIRGAWQSFVLADARFVFPIPDDVSEDAAAQYLTNPLTATLLRQAAESTLAAGYNGWVVQTAAAGAVGRLVAALFVYHRIPLISVVRTRDSAVALKERFPDVPVVTASDADWAEQITAIAGDRPITAALDAVGGPVSVKLLSLLSPEGTLFLYGNLSGEPITLSASAILSGRVSISHVNVLSWSTTASAVQRTWDVQTAELIARGGAAIHYEVAARYDIDEITAAIEHSRRPGKIGTVVVSIP